MEAKKGNMGYFKVIIIVIVIYVIFKNWFNEDELSGDSNYPNLSDEQLEEYEHYPVWSKEFLQYFFATTELDIKNFDKELGKIEKNYTEPNMEDYGEYQYIYYDEKMFLTDCYAITEKATEYMYIGEMKDDKPEGYGTIIRLCKDISGVVQAHQLVYVGEFENGYYEGFGIEFSSGGDENDSAYWKFINGENAQENIYQYCNSIRYIGYYESGKMHGEGMIIEYPLIYFLSLGYTDGIDMTDSDKEEYGFINIAFGEFKKDEMNGDFVVYSGENLRYKGKMKNNMFNGKGILYDEDGDVEYEGEFKNGEYVG